MVTASAACVALSVCFVLLGACVYVTHYGRALTIIYVVAIRVVQSVWIRSDDARNMVHHSLVRAILVSIANIGFLMSLMYVLHPQIWMRSTKTAYYTLAVRIYVCTVHGAWFTQMIWASVVFYTSRKQRLNRVALLSGQIVVVITYTVDAIWVAQTIFMEYMDKYGYIFEGCLLTFIHIMLMHTIVLSAQPRYRQLRT